MSLVGIPIHTCQVAGDTLRYSVKSEYGMGVTWHQEIIFNSLGCDNGMVVM